MKSRCCFWVRLELSSARIAARRVQAEWRSRVLDRGLTVLEQVPVNPESRRF